MNNELAIAVEAAKKAGAFLREHFGQSLHVNEAAAHDIKLELDVQTQALIEEILMRAFPDYAFYGEEGISGNQDSDKQWIVDPIDGTVNYFYGIPHFCTSIALRHGKDMVIGVIYDPMRDELWTVERGKKPQLNGKEVQVSTRTQLKDAILCVGFAKTTATINAGLPLLERMVHRARKCRMMGSAALDLAYISCGRLDAYLEQGVSLWDIAAGVLMIEEGGGKVDISPRKDNPDKLAVTAWNGVMDLQLTEEKE